MTCGTHGALEISFRVLCEPGRSILLPKPCYTIYKCLADALGILPKYYKLLVSRANLNTYWTLTSIVDLWEWYTHLTWDQSGYLKVGGGERVLGQLPAISTDYDYYTLNSNKNLFFSLKGRLLN